MQNDDTACLPISSASPGVSRMQRFSRDNRVRATPAPGRLAKLSLRVPLGPRAESEGTPELSRIRARAKPLRRRPSGLLSRRSRWFFAPSATSMLPGQVRTFEMAAQITDLMPSVLLGPPVSKTGGRRFEAYHSCHPLLFSNEINGLRQVAMRGATIPVSAPVSRDHELPAAAAARGFQSL